MSFFHEPSLVPMVFNTRAYLRLVLFDIDGTLISTNGIAREAFAEAFEQTFHRPSVARRHDFAGKTDQQIFYEVADASDIPAQEAERRKDAMFEQFFSLLEARLDDRRVTVHRGVTALLDALREEPAVTIGLLTGNMLRGARIKLGPPKLNDYFGFGAFGSDALYRYELPAVALERAYSRTGYAFKDKEIVIVGDTPHDIECGRHLNVRTIAVATGGASHDTLASHHPDFLFDTLERTHEVVEAILR